MTRAPSRTRPWMPAALSAFCAVGALASDGGSTRSVSASAPQVVKIDIRPEGPDEANRKMIERAALERVGFREDESAGRFKVLDLTLGEDLPAKERPARRESLEPQESDNDRDAGASPFRALVYDYVLQRLLEVSGDSRAISPSRFRVRESDEVPAPSTEEYEAAVELIRADPVFAPQTKKFRPYPSMPGVLSLLDSSPGRERRVITVGLLPADANSDFHHEIVGVDLGAGKVIRYPAGAPRGAIAREAVCAPSNAAQATSARGTRGKTRIVVSSAGESGEPLWSFDLIRPAASSGTRGSGIDLREVFYRGKRVAGQMHVPILNVRYVRDICGPYRDWTWQEGAFKARGEEIAPGILRASEKPLTIFESGRDAGNFRGVAIYREGAETVLVSETEAGWYRYKSEFRFRDDGSIRPVWGFAGVQSSCTCQGHVHHGYFRLDLDAGDGKHNQIQYFDGARWVAVEHEGRYRRDNSHRLWRVIDTRTGDGYQINPGVNDGIADAYARGDIWALKFNRGEIDDGAAYTGTAANVDAFLAGGREAIGDTDVVLWYAAHFYHNTDNFGAQHNAELGPIITPVNGASARTTSSGSSVPSENRL